MNGQGEGWVYVLTNSSMPDLVKIGFTRGRPSDRANQLSGTAIAESFVVACAFLVERPEAIEAAVHCQLKGYRVSSNREFFRCSLEIAHQTLMVACEGSATQELLTDGSAVSTVVNLQPGEGTNCRACNKFVRPFNSALTDREAGTTKCAWCGFTMRFRVVRSSSVPKAREDQKSTTVSHARVRLVGDYFGGKPLLAQCSACGFEFAADPCHLMMCASCGKHLVPEV